MKEKTISRNSWHFWLVTKLGFYDSRHHTDFCSYVRCVIGALLLSLILAAIAVFAGYIVVSTLYYGYEVIFNHHTKMDGWFGLGAFMGLFLLGIAALVYLGRGVKYLFNRRQEKRDMLNYEKRKAAYAFYDEHGYFPQQEEKQRAFIVEAYYSLKEKTCYRLKVEG